MSFLTTSPTRPATHLPFPWHRMTLYLALGALILAF